MLSFTDKGDKKGNYIGQFLNQRMDLLHDSDIEINVEDARNYNVMSMLLGEVKPDVIVQLAASISC